MKNVLILLALLLMGGACKKNELNPATLTAASLAGRSVLIYSDNFPGTGGLPSTFEVTHYDANGVPLQAKVSIDYATDVIPNGVHTSTLKLEYDAQLRLKKTVQTNDQLVYSANTPGFVVFDPNQQTVHEYEYQGNTTNITHEVAYWINAKKEEKKVTAEYFRTFTPKGQLTQEKLNGKLAYEAVYDANEKVVSETLFRDSAPAVTRQWENTYDSNQRLISRKIKGATTFENNTYDGQGRLLRRVTNLYALVPLSAPDPTVGPLVDYQFTKQTERAWMGFTYVMGHFSDDAPRVETYTYGKGEVEVTYTTYVPWQNLPQLAEPRFDFTQIPQEQLRSITQTKWRLNQWNKVASKESTYTYVSDKLQPEQRTPYETNTTSNRYSYDDRGNLIGSSGFSISSYTSERSDYPLQTARYKTF